jgi:alpha-glucosidase (family GH31 glycosyl hydrolase)
MEIALQMGMQGQAYMHSDLGGFAGPVLDDELYVRWLQYGVFQPIFRPHAQEEVPAEAIFRTPAVKALARDAIRLRYAMLPYNYTAAFDDSRTGMPMMRPVLFDDPDNEFMATTGISSTYLWGPDFLVAPVTEPGAARKEVFFPRKGSVWFDFYTDEPHHGGILETVATRPDRIPTYVRAGAFIPLAQPVQSTRDYSTARLDLHYWHDARVTQAQGHLYDDDGHTAHAFEAGKYELVRFSSRFADGRLALAVAPEPGAAATPTARTFDLKVHNVAAKPRAVRVGGKAVAVRWDAKRRVLDVRLPAVRTEALQVVVTL